MKRRGFTLTELLVMLPLIVAAGLLFSLLLPATIRHVPRLSQTLSRQRQIQHFLVRLREDVDAATEIPAQMASEKSGSQTLLLQTPAGALAYELRDGKVIRRQLTGPTAGETFEWDIPEATIEFQRWTRDKGDKTAYAVDVHTALTIRREGRTRNFFENHHVLFLHAMPPERKAKS